MRILRFYWQSTKHLNYRGYIYVWANILWIALTVLIITAPAAWAGLMILTYRSHTRIQVTLDDFWDGFKVHFWRATVNGIVTLLIILINVSNLLTYSPINWFGRLASFVWFFTLILWIGVQLYLWTVIEELKKPSLLLAYRNALVMVLRNPLFTVSILWIVALILILSFALPPILILLTGSTISILGVGGALNCFKQAGIDYDSEHDISIEQRLKNTIT